MSGDELTALDRVFPLFPTTREILRQRGPEAVEFSNVAVPVLNQIVRPFTAKCRQESLAGAFNHESKRQKFRAELAQLQQQLRNYNRILAEIAGVEDLIDLEIEEGDDGPATSPQA